MANRSRVITMSPLVLNHEDDLDLDLDLWEVVNPSDGEYSDDSFSVDSLSDDDVISLDDASFLISPPPQTLPVTDGGEIPADLDLDGAGEDDGDDVVARDQVDDKHLRWAQRRMVLLRRGSSTYSFGTTLGDYAIRGGFYGDGDSDHVVDDGEYDDSYDLDEELVPRSVCKKLGRQRMRKLGKRAIAKVLTSKTSPYAHLKPGCVRGKHGLGLKFKC